MVDATKIAKLRAKTMNTGFQEETTIFERKARELAAEHGSPTPISSDLRNPPDPTNTATRR
jgi:hypothetical protein